MENKKVAVIAIGGNSLVNRGRESIEDQYQAVYETAKHIADMIQAGWTVAVGHGNGPHALLQLGQTPLQGPGGGIGRACVGIGRFASLEHVGQGLCRGL